MDSHEGQFYDALAALYDQDWGTAYLDTAKEQFARHIQPHLAAGATILDLCSGTGQMAAFLTAEGYNVTGVDQSPNMIAFALENAPQARFVQAEMSEFALGQRFDAAMCSFNSLNHARGQRHLVRTLEHVYRHLLPGSYFLGDIVMAEGYANSWARTATVDVQGGECQLRFVYEPRRKRAYCDATLRIHGQEPVEVRMRQHIFTPQEIYAACAEAELKVHGLYPIPGDPPTGRVALVAQRLR